MTENYYNILGVSETATDEDIKAAYKRLAKQYHPDRHSGHKAFEEKFKKISEAYQTIGDPQRRAEYDKMRRYAHSGFRTAPEGAGVEFDLQDFLNHFSFAAGRRQSSHGGFSTFFRDLNDHEPEFTDETLYDPDVHSDLFVTLEDAVKGSSVEFEYRMDKTKTIRVNLPPGIDHGGKIKLKGQGNSINGQRGDLILTVNIMPDGVFQRKGNDIYCEKKVNLARMILGSIIRVKTVYDGTIDVKVPENTQPGTMLKISGHGVRTKHGSGDFYVKIISEHPSSLNKKQKELFETFARSCNMSW